VSRSTARLDKPASKPIAWNGGAIALSLGWDAVLKESPEDDPVQADLAAAYKRLGGLGMETELLREKIARFEGGVPFHRARSRK
jgi:hypothetical protein